MKRKFPNIPIAVCEDRVVGITNILADVDADVILLDDAFQHRYVRPAYQIVLSTYHHPFFTDQLLPVGRLREHPKHLKRADCIIYTKCPDGWEDQRERYIEQAKRFAPNALVCFSMLQYDVPKPLFNTSVDAGTVSLLRGLFNGRGDVPDSCNEISRRKFYYHQQCIQRSEL